MRHPVLARAAHESRSVGAAVLFPEPSSRKERDRKKGDDGKQENMQSPGVLLEELVDDAKSTCKPSYRHESTRARIRAPEMRQQKLMPSDNEILKGDCIL